MTTRASALTMLLATVCAACATEVHEDDEIAEQGSVTLSNPDDQGKSDTVFGKQLRYSVRAALPWFGDDTERFFDTRVISQTDDTVRAHAPLVNFDVPARRVMQLAVDAEEFNDFGELSTDMAFLLMVRHGEGWISIGCDGQSYFESVVIDRNYGELDAVARTEDDDSTARTYSFADCGVADLAQVAVFPFPSSNWGDMTGYYHLRLEAICDGSDANQSCPSARYVPLE